jgi:predicted amidophosphoribosyltransferase
MDSRSLTDIAWDELMSEVCANCGNAKRKKMSFCSKCYYKLPEEVRNNLYTAMSDGYAEIYDEAKELLKSL